MEKLEHIGIAVKDLKGANALFARLLGREHYKIENVESENVTTSFFEIGGVKIELLQATHEDSAISKFIDKKGEGVHHLAFEVKDIQDSIRHYQQLGFELVNPVAKKGADGKLICFLHPRSTGGVLVELCQSVQEP